MAPRAMRAGHAGETYEEKDFYLEEFRGRSVLVAVAPACVAARPDLGPLAATVTELVRNDTRVLLWWPAAVPGAERRLLGALARSRGRRRGAVPRMRLDAAVAADVVQPLSAALWGAVRRDRLCVLIARGTPAFPHQATELARTLRIPKLVLVDAHGGLLAAEP